MRIGDLEQDSRPLYAAYSVWWSNLKWDLLWWELHFRHLNFKLCQLMCSKNQLQRVLELSIFPALLGNSSWDFVFEKREAPQWSGLVLLCCCDRTSYWPFYLFHQFSNYHPLPHPDANSNVSAKRQGSRQCGSVGQVGDGKQPKWVTDFEEMGFWAESGFFSDRREALI